MMQLHLSEEYAKDEWTVSDPETYEVLKEFAMKNRPKAKAAIARPASPPPIKPAPKPMVRPKPRPKVVQKKEEPKPEVRVEATKIEREPMAAAAPAEFGDIKKILLEKGQKIQEEVPEDTEAVKISQQWKHDTEIRDVVVLTFGSQGSHKTFLRNLTKAIDLCIAPASLVPPEAVKETEGVKLVIAEENNLKGSPLFPILEKEKISIVFLENIEEYLQNPKLKQELWSQIKSKDV